MFIGTIKMFCANETCAQRTEISATSIQGVLDELRTIGWQSIFVDYCEDWYCPRCVKDVKCSSSQRFTEPYSSLG